MTCLDLYAAGLAGGGVGLAGWGVLRELDDEYSPDDAPAWLRLAFMALWPLTASAALCVLDQSCDARDTVIAKLRAENKRLRDALGAVADTTYESRVVEIVDAALEAKP